MCCAIQWWVNRRISIFVTRVIDIDVMWCDFSGRVEVRGESTHHSRDNFVATFAANKLTNKEGFFGKSNPFLKIYRCNEDCSYTFVWQNEHIDSSLNPRWSQTVSTKLTCYYCVYILFYFIWSSELIFVCACICVFAWFAWLCYVLENPDVTIV